MLPPGTKLEVHSKADCPFCVLAKDWLAERTIPYDEIRHDDPAERNSFYDTLGLEGNARTVPQVILVDGSDRFPIGGYQELKVSGLG